MAGGTVKLLKVVTLWLEFGREITPFSTGHVEQWLIIRSLKNSRKRATVRLEVEGGRKEALTSAAVIVKCINIIFKKPPCIVCEDGRGEEARRVEQEAIET